MFSHFIANKRSSADDRLNNYKVSPNNAAAAAKSKQNGRFWPASSSVWNLWPSVLQKPSSSSSLSSTRSKYYYKDFGQAERYHEQRQRSPLIELQTLSSSSSSLAAVVVAIEEPCPTPPPSSPSMFMIPRWDDRQLYSPVKLAAAPESRPKRIKFRPDDCDSLIEKFDKISIIASVENKSEQMDEADGNEEKKKDAEEGSRSNNGRVGRKGLKWGWGARTVEERW